MLSGKNQLLIFYLLFCIFVISNLSYAQNDDSAYIRGKYDSNTPLKRGEIKTKFPLTLQLNLIPMQLNLSKAKYINEFSYSDLIYKCQMPIDAAGFYGINQISQRILQSDLRNTFKLLQRDRLKYDLGWVGQALGYINAAAVLGLAAYHIYKYEIKKEKDD